MNNIILLDTSAFLTWAQDEPGADEIEAYFEEAMEGRVTLNASFVSLTEIEYIATQKFGADKAKELLESVEEQSVHWRHSDKSLCSAAAKLKAAHKISFAYAFVAASAQRVGGVLVHKDPEFNALAGVIPMQMLPPKSVEAS